MNTMVLRRPDILPLPPSTPTRGRLRFPMRLKEELNSPSLFLADRLRGKHCVVDAEYFLRCTQLQHIDERSDIRQIGLASGPQFHG